MTFEELGASLRTEREKRGLRLEDAAEKLKINPRLLRALEEGNINSLPHAAYAKGFIRSYATWLGWSADEIQQAMASLNGIPVKPLKKSNPDALEMPEKVRSSSHAGLYVIIFFLALAGAGWWLWQSGRLDWVMPLVKGDEQKEAPLQTADHYLAEKDADKARKAEEAGRNGQSAQREAESQPEYVLPVPGNTPPALPDKAAKPAETGKQTTENDLKPVQADNSLPEKAPEEAANAVEPDQHKLVITAIEECWVHSNADKTDTRQFSLRKGDTFALTFSKSLELKLGNAGGVRLRYDGNDMPPPGTSGQVRTIVFPVKERP